MLAVHHQDLGRGGDDGLKSVLQRPTVGGLVLIQLIEDDDLGLQKIFKLAVDLLVLDDGNVRQRLTADGPQERREQRIFAAALRPVQQQRVVDLDAGVLELECERVQNVLTLDRKSVV